MVSEQNGKSGLSKTLELLSLPAVMELLMIRLAVFLPAVLMQVMGAVITMEHFKLGPQENGLLMAVIGAALAVCMIPYYLPAQQALKRWVSAGGESARGCLISNT